MSDVVFSGIGSGSDANNYPALVCVNETPIVSTDPLACNDPCITTERVVFNGVGSGSDVQSYPLVSYINSGSCPSQSLPVLPIATTISLGIMQVGAGLSVIDGIVSVETQGLPYSIVTDTDPATVPNPPTGKVYFGSFGGRLWKKLSSGVITYMQKETTLYDYYTASGTEASVTLTYLIGAVGIQIVKGTQPLKPDEFTFDSSTGLITFVTALGIYETIFITYQKNVDL